MLSSNHDPNQFFADGLAVKHSIGLGVTKVHYLLTGIGYLFREIWYNLPIRHTTHPFEMPPSGSRILLVAPHPDDEIAGSAAFIRQALQNGSMVKIIVVTNGDGIGLAESLRYKIFRMKAPHFIKTGAIRQNETRAALSLLGVPPENIVFLGYPDACLLDLWTDHWSQDHPFTSPYTGQNRGFYSDTFAPGSLFAGSNLVQDLELLIKDYAPTHLLYPGYFDRHKDHFSCYNFIKYTIAKMQLDINEILYLMHRGIWPSPPGNFHFLALTPPHMLRYSGIRWLSLMLTPEDMILKMKCLKFFKSQIVLMKLYLKSFVRCNELFCENDDNKLSQHENNNVSAEESLAFSFTHPLAGLTGYLHKAADIAQITGKLGPSFFVVEVRTLLKPCTSYQYRINLYLFHQDGMIKRITAVIKQNQLQMVNIDPVSYLPLEQTAFNVEENGLKLILPAYLFLGIRCFLVSASSASDEKNIDDTGVRMVSFKSAPAEKIQSIAL